MRQVHESGHEEQHHFGSKVSSYSKNNSSRKKSEDVSSIFFEEESFIQKNQSYEFLYQEPELPPKVIGSVRRCYKIFSCMSSQLIMALDYQSVKFYQVSSEKLTNPRETIQIHYIKQIRSYKKKDQYFLRLITKDNQSLDLRFSNKDVCKQWIGYFNQALEFHDYLLEREHYSNKETFNQFMKTITNKNQNIVKLEDSTVVSDRAKEESAECENTTLIKKKISIVRLADFKATHRIGKGAFSVVYKAEKDGKIYALKQMNKDQLLFRNQMKYALTQLTILRRCQACPFIIPLYYAFQTEDYLYLTLKYSNCGNLQQHLDQKGPLTYQQALFIVTELVSAVQFLHQQNILYRDLKPDNIMLTKQGHILLIDFGLSRELNSRQEFAETFVGTPLYLIPQRLEGDGKVNYKGDIYGVGCVFYAILHGKTPFQGQSLQSIMLNIRNESVEIRKDIDPLAQAFLRQTLQKNPDKRLAHMSSHPLFQGVNWTKVRKMQAKSCIQTKEKKGSDFIGIKSINDQDYTQQNYPNKKVNDWNFAIKH